MIEEKRTLYETMIEINKLATELLRSQINFMQEKQRREDAIVFFCNHGKFPDEA